ncbi:hypothetical protein CY35_18G090800 [Sphagnum magellanicum]|nr:hypothetical protein CY35_18G090800 [Sphagnum magellanicum]
MDSLHKAYSRYVCKDGESGDDASSRNLRVNVDTGGSTFQLVEKTNWNEGTWSDTESTRYTLIVNGPDVSGTLRFMGPRPNGAEDPEFFLVAVGYDTAPWCDLKVNVGAAETGAFFQPKYYDVEADEHAPKQDHQTTVTGRLNSGTTITVTLHEDNVVTVT